MPKNSPAGLTPYVLNKFSKKPPPVPRHPGRRFDPSSATRSGKEYRTPLGSRLRWRHRGDERNALDRTIPAILGTGVQLSCHESLRYRAGTPSQHRQTNRLYTAGWELARHNGSFLGVTASDIWHPANMRLRIARRLASPILQQRASQRGPFLVLGRRRSVVAGKISVTTPTDGVYLVRFWSSRDRSSFLFLRRATRPRRELYDVLGVCKYTWLAR